MPRLSLPAADPPAPVAFAGTPGLSQDRPLFGLTILAVEDSRFACEALRLMCQRAGARLRRAETLAGARAHLRVYRPDVVIVDLGLPDGRGEGLIRALMLAHPRPGLVLGASGAVDGRARALAAGADGFLDKPLESYADFCATLCRLLPDLPAPPLPQDPSIRPDPLALHDDLAHAAAVLADNPDRAAQDYALGFVAGLARHAHDSALIDASTSPVSPDALARLRALIDARLMPVNDGFS